MQVLFLNDILSIIQKITEPSGNKFDFLKLARFKDVAELLPFI